MNNMNNMKLWQAVGKTDPSFTKKAKKGQYHFTSIAPMYQIQMATEQWGPFGSSWGIDSSSEKFSQTTIADTILINYDAILKYPDGSFPIHASEKLAYKTTGSNSYLKVDEEARKKVVTNALTKGLSMLGFNADIFTGLFDDIDYVNQVGTEKAIEKAEDKDAEIEKAKNELVDYVERHLKSIDKANTVYELSGIYKSSSRHLDRQRSIIYLSEIAARGLAKIQKTYETKKGTLENV